ncbi:hypothetical protein JB92DRAFT_2185484 [Gautieria morchelliformis]|nr:hypothetical protein JB92DRAFT_2185484 [Gautieria morchelliformis]
MPVKKCPRECHKFHVLTPHIPPSLPTRVDWRQRYFLSRFRHSSSTVKSAMFFSTELLSKKDSGYGLCGACKFITSPKSYALSGVWHFRLAPTLGSISMLKKLHSHSVLTADINQLCTLISEPPEPLALRLSSNLMAGVVRLP